MMFEILDGLGCSHSTSKGAGIDLCTIIMRQNSS